MENDNENKVVEGDTCFSAHERNKKNCPKKACKYWIDNPETQNCSIIAANTHMGMTLEQIGTVFGLTRMRVCQIEKSIYKKISPLLNVIQD